MLFQITWRGDCNKSHRLSEWDRNHILWHRSREAHTCIEATFDDVNKTPLNVKLDASAYMPRQKCWHCLLH
ncbi:hypothetical protein FBZ98_10447 [Rhizobium sp. ERR 922]|nr:hypothetical protein FBZ98_10447 [Rhizobium sp. ERR 922]TWB95914.1 hypothetical protein FBZ97_104603 [Rhizobium sp. ERR 942]